MSIFSARLSGSHAMVCVVPTIQFSPPLGVVILIDGSFGFNMLKVLSLASLAEPDSTFIRQELEKTSGTNHCNDCVVLATLSISDQLTPLSEE